MFIGIKDGKHGNLSWPRKIDNITFQVPNDLKIAVVLQGIRMNTEDKSESNILRKQGVKKYTTAEASIEYAEDSSIKTVLENGIYKEVFDRYVSRWVYQVSGVMIMSTIEERVVRLETKQGELEKRVNDVKELVSSVQKMVVQMEYIQKDIKDIKA